MRRSEIRNRIISGSATIIALIALVTGLYQAKLSRDQAKASVWPYIIQGNSGNNGYARIIQNVGLRPAVVQSFEVLVDGKPVSDWRAAVESLGVKLSWRGSRTTTFKAGIVAPTNALIELLELPDSGDVRLFRAAMVRDRKDRPQTVVCYCSLYRDCWANHSGDYQPARVKACVDDPARRFLD